MKRRSVFLCVVLMVLTTAACATVGRKFDMDAARKYITIGESTKMEVSQLCGEPLSRETQGDTEIWHYSCVEKNVTGIGLCTNIFGLGTQWRTAKQKMDVYFIKDVVSDIKTESSEDTKVHY